MPPPIKDRQTPALTARAEAQKLARAEREAQALRENLRRRKAQARAREAHPDPRRDDDTP